MASASFRSSVIPHEMQYWVFSLNIFHKCGDGGVGGRVLEISTRPSHWNILQSNEH